MSTRTLHRCHAAAVIAAAVIAAATISLTGCANNSDLARRASISALREGWVLLEQRALQVASQPPASAAASALHHEIGPDTPTPLPDDSLRLGGTVVLPWGTTTAANSVTFKVLVAASGYAGGGDLYKQATTYTCAEMTLNTLLGTTESRGIACRSDLEKALNQRGGERISLRQLTQNPASDSA